MSVCPYYQTDYKMCNIFDTYQDGSHKENCCLSSDNWRRCENYDRSSYDVKVSKRVRPNPDL